MKKKKLIYDASRANLTGSKKTQFNQKKEAIRFAKILYQNDFGVQLWKNVSNKHVSFVIEHWKNNNLAISTIKEYLVGVRAVARAYGNTKIHVENIQFGLPSRRCVTNKNNAMPDAVYQRLRESLWNGDERMRRLGAQIDVMRELGLRHEEARKMNPANSLLDDGRIYISAGTKGGRDRVLNFATERQREAVRALAPFIGSYGNSMPDNMKERTWEHYAYSVLRGLGITKKLCGASLHGLRHAYAHQRYYELMGVEAPCCFESLQDFRAQALAGHGTGWREKHRQVANIITRELGHNRLSVTAIYLGTHYR